MKKMLAVLFAVVFSAAVGLAHDNDEDVVRWRSIVGVITTPGVNNPVAGINAGATAWTTHSGRASVNLQTGFTAFEVEGLVIVRLNVDRNRRNQAAPPLQVLAIGVTREPADRGTRWSFRGLRGPSRGRGGRPKCHGGRNRGSVGCVRPTRLCSAVVARGGRAASAVDSLVRTHRCPAARPSGRPAPRDSGGDRGELPRQDVSPQPVRRC